MFYQRKMLFKPDKLISHNQEAERNKTQLDFVLHQKMETFKEEQSKTKLDRAHSKSKVKGEESKDSLPKKSDTQLSGQKKDQVRKKTVSI